VSPRSESGLRLLGGGTILTMDLQQTNQFLSPRHQ
jgi:hypothetical protein